MKVMVSWILFWIGHIVSRPISWWGWAWPYPVYNWLMTKSLELDEHSKVWEKPKDE